MTGGKEASPGVYAEELPGVPMLLRSSHPKECWLRAACDPPPSSCRLISLLQSAAWNAQETQLKTQGEICGGFTKRSDPATNVCQDIMAKHQSDSRSCYHGCNRGDTTRTMAFCPWCWETIVSEPDQAISTQKPQRRLPPLSILA